MKTSLPTYKGSRSDFMMMNNACLPCDPFGDAIGVQAQRDLQFFFGLNELQSQSQSQFPGDVPSPSNQERWDINRHALMTMEIRVIGPDSRKDADLSPAQRRTGCAWLRIASRSISQPAAGSGWSPRWRHHHFAGTV
ncbi:MAG: hypothetical protein WKF37_17760 [Bryobacteraceae bacterium]